METRGYELDKFIQPTKYQRGDQFIIPRKCGNVIGSIILCEDLEAKILFTIGFTDIDGLAKCKRYTEEELDMLDRYFYEDDTQEMVLMVLNESNILSGNNAETLKSSIETYETPEGAKIAAATDRGLGIKKNNEDRVVVDSGSGIVGVIDGMGGEKNGEAAAQLIAEEIQSTPLDIVDACKRASIGIQECLGRGGACLTAIDLKRKLIFHVGDTKCIVFDENGLIKFQTKDQSLVQGLVDSGAITEDEALYSINRHIIFGMIKGGDSSSLTVLDVDLKKGDRIVLLSDGIGDNLTNDEIGEVIYKRTAEESIRQISDITDQRMRNIARLLKEDRANNDSYSDGYRSEPKLDNRAIAVIDL